jgi:hypothetical protein
MSPEDIHTILEKVSTDNTFKTRLLMALAARAKEDPSLKQDLLKILEGSPQPGENKAGPGNSRISPERILQLILSGILLAYFVIIAALTVSRIGMAPQGAMLGGRMQMYDPFVRAKDLLTMFMPLFTTIMSFWLGFSIQEKKVTQERDKREQADEMMPKIKGRTMMPSDMDDVAMLQQHIREIMEGQKPGG